MAISLTRNLQQVDSLDDLREQLSVLFANLEDYLNNTVSVYLVDQNNKNKRRPTFKKGDLVFDLTKEIGVATLQQWDGEKLILLGINTITGFINLIERGIGSGNDRNFFLASDGEGGWELRQPDRIEFNATEFIPAFSLVTATGKVADSSNLAHWNRVIGMVDKDVDNGFIGEAIVDGEVTNPLWAWAPGSKLFLNGTATSLTPAPSGFSQMVALARNAQIIIMKLGESILL